MVGSLLLSAVGHLWCADDEKAVQQFECHRRDSEEIEGHDHLAMVLEGQPPFGGQEKGTDAFYVSQTSAPDKLQLPTSCIGAVWAFGGAPAGKDLQAPTRVALELTEELARSQRLTGVGRTADGIALGLGNARQQTLFPAGIIPDVPVGGVIQHGVAPTFQDMRPRARPRPVPRHGGEPGAHRVEFDVA